MMESEYPIGKWKFHGLYEDPLPILGFLRHEMQQTKTQRGYSDFQCVIGEEAEEFQPITSKNFQDVENAVYERDALRCKWLSPLVSGNVQNNLSIVPKKRTTRWQRWSVATELAPEEAESFPVTTALLGIQDDAKRIVFRAEGAIYPVTLPNMKLLAEKYLVEKPTGD